MVVHQKQVLIIADSCPIYSRGIKDILRHNKHLEPSYVTNIRQTMQLLQQHTSSGVVFTDCFLNIEGGVRCIRAVKEKFPQAKLLVITECEPALIRKYITTGVHGVINKHTHLTHIETALHHICATNQLYCCEATQKALNGQHISNSSNKRILNHNEEKIILLSYDWKTSEQIATILNLSIGTVNYYRQQVKQKLKANGFEGPLQYALANALI